MGWVIKLSSLIWVWMQGYESGPILVHLSVSAPDKASENCATLIPTLFGFNKLYGLGELNSGRC